MVGLEKSKVSASHIDAIKDMYERVVTSVRTVGGETRGFPIRFTSGIETESITLCMGDK